MLKFSIIIPCYHDEQVLRCLLEQLKGMPRYTKEIIVVDGGSTSVCREICRDYHARWLPSQPCRGQQLLTGSSAAQGDILWFLHADARVSRNALVMIGQAIDNGAVGGFFKFRFDAPQQWPVSVLEWFIALRCRYGVPYGDQGLFILRKSYHAAGGHAPWPLFEEVPLVRGIRQIGQFVALREHIWVNPRRWQQDGWWRRTWRNRKLALKFACGVAPEALITQYQAEQSHSEHF